jgi:hypothetical protein
MLVEVVVGERKAANNVQADGRGGAYSELIVNDVGFGRYFEAARQGRVFMASSAVGATLNGQTNPLGAAGTAVLALHNPPGNTKAAVILKATAALIGAASATLVLPVWNYIPAPTGITGPGTSLALNMLLGGPASTMKTFVNAVLTGSAAATYLRHWHGSFTDPRHAGAASETSAAVLVEETEGSIIVPPGVCLIANTAPAGAAITGSLSIVYTELDWPL